jgi:hypothetical protein
MPSNSNSVNIGHIEYESTVDGPMNILVDDKPLLDTLFWYLYESEISVGNPFDKRSKQIKFAPQVEEICFKVLDVIKQIKINDKKEAALLGARLYESFTNYWICLLSSGRDVIGIRSWENVLSITYKWEENNKPITIHKGTPYFFLAENYLLLGDRDLGFQYLYSALLDDTTLGAYAPSLNYPICAPSI